MKKVIVTGASGFIGRHSLIPLIKAGYEVHAVFNTRKPLDIEHRLLFWHKCDILKPEEQKNLLKEVQASHLLHFAWYATHSKFWTSNENLLWVAASIGLIMNFAEHGGSRVVCAGTCAEYDWNYGFCTEDVTPVRPSTLYGVCKNSFRSMSEQFFMQAGISNAWGRIFLLYGPHECSARLVASVIRALLLKEPALCSSGTQLRDFLYIEDAACAFVSLLDSNIQGPVNIASGQPVRLKDVAELIAEKIGKKELLRLGSLSLSADDPPLLLANIIRLKNEVGWIPKYDLNTGLDLTIKWWKSFLSQD